MRGSTPLPKDRRQFGKTDESDCSDRQWKAHCSRKDGKGRKNISILREKIRKIDNHRTVWLERQSIIREKIVSFDRGKKVARREKLYGEFEHFLLLKAFQPLLGGAVWLQDPKSSASTPLTHATEFVTFHRWRDWRRSSHGGFSKSGVRSYRLHPHVFQRLVDNGGRCGESTVLRLHSISLPKRFIVRNRPRFANEFPLLSSLSKRISLIFSSHWANVGKDSDF